MTCAASGWCVEVTVQVGLVDMPVLVMVAVRADMVKLDDERNCVQERLKEKEVSLAFCAAFRSCSALAG